MYAETRVSCYRGRRVYCPVDQSEADIRKYEEEVAARAARKRHLEPSASLENDPAGAVGNLRPDAQRLDVGAVLNLQRLAGNRAVAGLLEASGIIPKLQVSSFGRRRFGQREFGQRQFGPASFVRPSWMGNSPDKSVDPNAEEQDQSVDTSTFVATAKGVRIIAEASGVTESAEFPDGFKFTQVIETNNPLHGATSPYVDPHPNDDSKPFYWTDAEQTKYPTTFRDAPGRTAPTGTAATWWQATLGLNGVNEATKSVTGYDYLTYGFTLDSAGNVTINGPASIDGTNHRTQLAAEFSGWTFA